MSAIFGFICLLAVSVITLAFNRCLVKKLDLKYPSHIDCQFKIINSGLLMKDVFE